MDHIKSLYNIADLPKGFWEKCRCLLNGQRSEFHILGSKTGDGLWEACQMVAGKYSLKEQRHRDWHEVNHDTRLDSILYQSGLRHRKVNLMGVWYQSDVGNILAFTKNGTRPVAIIQERSCEYWICDPVLFSKKKLNSSVLNELEPEGVVFYQPLPPGPFNVKTMLSYALRGSGSDLYLIIFTGLLGALISLLVPSMTRIIFSSSIPNSDRAQVLEIGLALLLSAFVSVMFRMTSSFAILRVEGRSDHFMQTGVWDRLLRLPVGFFRSFSTGDLASRSESINAIRQALSGSVVMSILGLLFSFFNLIVILSISWKLGVLAVVLAVLGVGVELTLARAQLKHQRSSLAVDGQITSKLLQILNGLIKWKITASEHRAHSLWYALFLKKKEMDLKLSLIKASSTSFTAAYVIFTTLINYGFYYIYHTNTIGTGSFLSYNSAFTQLISGLKSSSAAIFTLVNLLPQFERVRPILDSAIEPGESKGDPGIVTGHIELRDVAFRYNSDSPPVLKNISFTAKSGDYIAIVGSSGCGKSTLVRILLGFEKPSFGQVLYDGQDLSDVDIRSVRRQLGVVLQNDCITSGSIYQNIVGSRALSLDSAWEAAEKAGIKEDIIDLPMGMHTHINESGTTFSGGQLQRIVIARALVNNPRVLIFDEATSALDNVTQGIVAQTLRSLTITRIVIAQRLSTILNADRILVLDKGQITEDGNYEQLMAQNGLFKRLADRQLL